MWATDASRSRFQHKLKFHILAMLRESVLMVPSAASTQATKLKNSSASTGNNTANASANVNYNGKSQAAPIRSWCAWEGHAYTCGQINVCVSSATTHRQPAAQRQLTNSTCVVDAYTLSLVIVCALSCQNFKRAHDYSLFKCQSPLALCILATKRQTRLYPFSS